MKQNKNKAGWTKVGALLTLLFFVAGISLTAQTGQKMRRSVSGNAGGGVKMSGATKNFHGSLSQTCAAYISTPGSNKKHGSGFWYAAGTGGTPYMLTVGSDSIRAAIGTEVTLIFTIKDSKKMDAFGFPLDFTGEVRFNKTILEPIGIAGVTEDGNEWVIPITGQMANATVGTQLFTMRVRTRLGNAISTPVHIETFAITQTKRPVIARVDGAVFLDGVCMEGGVARLIYAGIASRIEPPNPNPAASLSKANYQAGEVGKYELYAIDALGRRMKTFYEGFIAVTGQYELPLDLTEIPNGKYFLVLKTPTEQLYQSMNVAK